ncbi:MAG: hypothetical protein ABIY50_01460 [Ignavibacteria bacterium]
MKNKITILSALILITITLYIPITINSQSVWSGTVLKTTNAGEIGL